MDLAKDIAYFYVNYGIPAGKVFLLFMAIMAVIYCWSFIKDPAKQIDMASKFFNWVVTTIVAVVMGVGIGIYETFRFFWRVLHVIFSTLRDFFMSRI